MRKNNLICTLFLFNIFFYLNGRDTTLIRIIDLEEPIRTIIKDSQGRLYVQVMDKVYEIKKNILVETDLKVNVNDKIYFHDRQLTSADKLIEQGIKVPNKFYQNLAWNKFLAYSGTENYCVAAKDNEGNYWVNNGSKFLYCFKIYDLFERSLNKISTRGIFEYKNKVFVNTYSGFFKDNSKLISDFIYGSSNIFENSGNLYFASIDKVYSLNLENEKIKIWYNDSLKKITNEISCIMLFDNKFWIGSLNGLFSLKEDSTLKREEIKGIIHNLRVRDNKLYICSDFGIYVYQKGRFEKFPLLEPNIRYNDIEEINGCFYIASSNGLIFFDPKNNFKKNVFLNSNNNYNLKECFSLEKDNYYNLWIGTVNGIIRYNLITEDGEVFYNEIEFNKKSTFKINDKFYFGSTDGYFKFTTNKFRERSDFENITISNNSKSKWFPFQIFVFIGLSICFYVYHKWKLTQVMNKKNIEFNFEDEPQILNSGSTYTMSNIEKYIKDHIEDITVEKLREDSGYTKNVFYRVFSQHYDITPKQLIESIKEEKFRKRNRTHRIK